ncbi:hypothetical protein KO507_08580 [Gilvimarinus agarilyticus]|nr:hypothetical protein [Gilvimarinus agarilyticus]
MKQLRNKIFALLSDWDSINPIILTSTGRTGTKFFADFFHKFFDDVLSIHEPEPDLLNLSVSYKTKKISADKAYSMFKNSRLNQYQQAKKYKHYFEANNNLTLLTPVLAAKIPTLRVIHVSRHPYTFIRSAYHKKNTHRGEEYLFYHENDKRRRITPFDTKEITQYSEWLKLPRILKIAWYWNTYNKNLLELNHSIKNYCLIKYENVFDDRFRHQELSRMVTFLAMTPKDNFTFENDFFKEKINKSEYDDDIFKKEIEPYTEQILNICGDTMKKLEYEWQPSS